MSFKEAATELVREALDGRMRFIVLRGLDGFSHDDGDIDVIVPQSLAIRALSLVGEKASENGWAIAGIGDIGYLSQICLVKRWGDDARHRAVKVDFFNGASWAALGTDPLGRALFDGLEENDEREATGVATLLQKMLYAGYLRDRDRERIAATCAYDQIAAFAGETGLPLTRADLEHGRLSRMARWRLRAASAGASPVGLPVWIAKVIWRKLHFAVVRSTFPGAILMVSGADGDRWPELAGRFQSLLERSGFPKPTIASRTNVNGPAVTSWLLTAWRALRGETVLVNHSRTSSAARIMRRCSTALQITLPDRRLDAGDDLNALLDCVSQQALNTLRRKRTS